MGSTKAWVRTVHGSASCRTKYSTWFASPVQSSQVFQLSVAVSLFLSILTVISQVKVLSRPSQGPGTTAGSQLVSLLQAAHATSTPLSHRIFFPKRGPDPITHRLRNSQRLPLPPAGQSLSGPSYFSSFIFLPTKHVPLTRSDWPLKVAQTSWHHHCHPRTMVLTIHPPPRDISCPLSFCIMEQGGRGKYTAALNTSTKQREPLPG